MSGKKTVQIAEYADGKTVNSWLLIQEAGLRETRDAKPYLDLMFRDSSAFIRGKWWQVDPGQAERFRAGLPVAVTGRVQSFNDELQLSIEKMVPVNEKQHGERGFSWALLLPVSPVDPGEMYEAMLERIGEMEDESLKALCGQIFREEKEALLTHPASLILHHAYIGGYLHHVQSMLQLAEGAEGIYTIQRDLLTAGILLHDIGKLRELSGFPDNHYTDEGNFIGHIVIGWDMVNRVMDGIEDFPEDLRMKLGHIILSHQGKYEYQSPKKPAIAEALLVHYFDELDARMNMFSAEIGPRPGSRGDWTSQRNLFGVPLYRK